jgi:hypothetical protein
LFREGKNLLIIVPNVRSWHMDYEEEYGEPRTDLVVVVITRDTVIEWSKAAGICAALYVLFCNFGAVYEYLGFGGTALFGFVLALYLMARFTKLFVVGLICVGGWAVVRFFAPQALFRVRRAEGGRAG